MVDQSRIDKAQSIALGEGGLDYILEVIPTPDFVEVVGKTGGDTLTYRITNDGKMYSR